MPRRARGLAVLLTAALVAPVYFAGAASPAFKVLLFTKTAGARHASIDEATVAIQKLGAENGFEVVASESSADFSEQNLAQYQAVVFGLTSGEVLNDPQEAALRQFISTGKGFVGIHSAADTETASPWFSGLVGATFRSQPGAPSNATVKVLDKVHPSTATLPTKWQRTDEWYNFKTSPRGSVHVLATVDESTYAGGSMGYDHPIEWCQKYGGGRSWYTALGHTEAAWSEVAFLQNVLGGIKYAAGATQGDCGATISHNFDTVRLADQINQPMSLEVAPDGRVFVLERTGTVKIFKPSSSEMVSAGTLTVSSIHDHGLQGIALDPSFDQNGFVYLFYTAPPVSKLTKCPEYDNLLRAQMGNGCETNRLSRFRVIGDSLDLSSEKILTSFQILNHCCHQGGSLAFDPSGNLYLSTGDDTSAFDSQGFTPIDERPLWDLNDAQRSSGNKFDPRGKILRIKPTPSGGYTVPAGNLFPSDGSQGLPEIFVMGTRNPFRMTVDDETGWVYWGDVGPDANFDDVSRGPRGYDEINQARGPGNFGWPYCIANNQPYQDYDYLSKTPKGAFNCNAPVNDSRNANEAGAWQTLPPSKSALIWYPYTNSPEFPGVGIGSRTAEAGPVFHYNATSTFENKLPQYFDDSLFIYEWSRGWIKEVKLDDNGNVLAIVPLVGRPQITAPIDLEQGPDGALYMLDWGSTQDYNHLAPTPIGSLVRIDYVDGRHTPVASAAKSGPLGGPDPLSVTFSSEGSSDLDPNDVLSYAWDFTSDGIVDSTLPSVTHTYERGNWNAKLTVTDLTGRSSSTSLRIASGNSIPIISYDSPHDGQIYQFGKTRPFRVKVQDAEDGTIEVGSARCARIVTQVSLGHNDHSHPMMQVKGCSGEFTLGRSSHGEDANLYVALVSSYTDDPTPDGIDSVTGSGRRYLHPSRKQAEFFTSQSGVAPVPSGDQLGGGGSSIGFTQTGDWIAFKPMALDGIKAVRYRAGAAQLGGRIEVRVDSPTGPIVSEAQIPPTGAFTNYVDIQADLAPTLGEHEIFFVFRSPLPMKTGDKYFDQDMSLFNLNWIDFLFDKVAEGVA